MNEGLVMRAMELWSVMFVVFSFLFQFVCGWTGGEGRIMAGTMAGFAWRPLLL